MEKGKEGDVLGSATCNGESDRDSTASAGDGSHGTASSCNKKSDHGSAAFTGEEDHGGEEMEAQRAEEDRTVTETPRVGYDEEAELVAVLRRFRRAWEEDYSEYFGPFEGISTYSSFTCCARTLSPIPLFHTPSIFLQDCSLELIGPSRAIALIDPPRLEVELSVIGSSPSEVKILSAAVITYNNLTQGHKAGLIQTEIESRKRSTVEVKFSHLCVPLEATIEIHHSGASSDFHGEFFAHVKYMGEEKVVLLDSKDRNVTIQPDGKISLSRCVVLVREGAELILGVKVWQGKDYENAIVSCAGFTTKLHSKSDGEFNFPFCKMSVSVFWSVLC
ncbi:hypothetical protein EJB05_17261, partial [Eragrostis curvula]